LIVPPDYQPILDANLHVHYLDDTATSLNAIGNSDFNIVISNTQKIVIKQKSKEDTAAEKLFKTPSLLSGLYDDEELKQGDNLIINQRFERLCELNQLGVYVDEGHHLFGTDLEKALHDKSKETSLRKTINMLSEKLKSKGSSVVACYNYTGTPYVNNRILPEVVYSCGLSESILNGYLKDADPQGFENVKDIEYLNASIQRFMEAYKGQTFEGLVPKMAIYAATVDEAVNIVKPAVESAIAKYGLGPDKVLVNVGDSKYTKDVDIKYFNNLDVKDTPGSQKQFIILCEKGTEGWNCRSLFAVCLFRDSFSRVFVLQSTMRCLRAITDTQQTAQIFLSKKNWDILNDELHKNFNMDIKDLGNKNKKERKFYQVRVLPPPRYLTVNVLSHRYSLEERKENKPVDFELEKTDFSQYESKIYIKNGMASSSTVKEENADKYKDKIDYSLYTLTAELARYLNLSPMKVMGILDSSVDGADLVLEKTNLYNEIVYDILAPKIFDSLYKVKVERVASPKKLLLLKEPKDSAYYEFSANPDLVVKDSAPEFVPYKAKSFHADTYCFDSNPEKELFNQYIKSKDVQSVYFTGMFTAGQGDLCIQYVDPETHRVRSYYPDFVAKMKDGSYQIIEVKGDNMIDNAVVKAKAAAAEEIATESAMEYKMYAGNFIMKNNVLQKKTAFYDFGDTGELLVADGKKIDGVGEADKNRIYNIRH